jgi:TRAP-type C4-dicarboxylate transport system substrate-binding protein
VVDKKAFDTLSAQDQKAVDEEFGAAFTRLEKINRDDNAQARAALQKQGIEIFKPNAQEAASWEAVGTEARKQLSAAGEITPDMAAALDKAVSAARGGTQ